ncbi:MAG: hypothetical protein AMXMBFR64_23860 [Myxococcales bacterium]
MGERVCFQCCQTAGPGDRCQRCGRAPGGDGSDDANRLEMGTVLQGTYLVGRDLGWGGFGITYLARHLKLKVRRAIKEYYPRSSATRSRNGVTVQPVRGGADAYGIGLRCFLREAEMVAQLESAPNVVTVYDFFEENGTGYMVMEYVQGVTLQALLSESIQAGRGPLPEDQAVPIGIAVLDGLRAVHSKREEQDKVLIHRDIKPANIMVSRDGPVVLVDFGAARYTTGSVSQSLSEVVTEGYAPPEQYDRRAPQDERTDVYALGATLWTVLAGETPVEALVRQSGRRLPPLKEVARVSTGVSDAVERAMSLDPAQRFPTARAFQQALQGAIRRVVPPSPAPVPVAELVPDPPPPPRPVWPPDRPASSPEPARLAERRPGPAPEPARREAADRAAPHPQPARDWGRVALVASAVIAVGAGLILLGTKLAQPSGTGGDSSGSGAAEASSAPAERVGPPESLPAPPEPAQQVQRTPEPPEERPADPAPPKGYVRIEKGTFTMGSPDGTGGTTKEESRFDEEVQHPVTLRGAFYLKATEVTQGEWESLMGSNPSYFKGCGARCPVERVSWWEALYYLNALSRSEGVEECYDLGGCTGTLGGGCPSSENGGRGCHGDYTCTSVKFKGLGCQGYRLPTEAEWEHAARGETTTATYAGDLSGEWRGDLRVLDGLAWYVDNAAPSYDGAVDCSDWSWKANPQVTRCGPQPAGGKSKNAYGLYDMLGNVFEWTGGCYAEYETGPVTDVGGPVCSSTGADRVVRGGSWGADARNVRAALRVRNDPAGRYFVVGFRAARSIP